jgi:lipid-binding SYLF domain-containing protein
MDKEDGIMHARESSHRIGNRLSRLIAPVLATALLLSGIGSARADDADDAKQIVDKAKLSVEQFQKDATMDAFRDLAKKAHGMLILPQMVRGAFIIGASGGSGVLVARDGVGAPWRGPAFHTLGGASFGFQAGVDVAEVVILAMTERGVTKLLSPQVKLGADISVAAGPVGAGAAAATAGLSADLVSYSMGKGVYGGFSVDGSVVGVRTSLNQAYYGKEVTPTDILIKGTVRNPQADPLLELVKQLGGGK